MSPRRSAMASAVGEERSDTPFFGARFVDERAFDRVLALRRELLDDDFDGDDFDRLYAPEDVRRFVVGLGRRVVAT